MGTPDFAVPALEALFAFGCNVVGVVSQPDRPKGRGRKVERTPVAACADRHGVPVFQWPRLRDVSYETLRDLSPDLMVVAAYGKILPQRYLDLPKYGCLNVHASLLPALRGAAPIQWAVLRGLPETGVTIMRMAAGMDTGPVAATLRTPIGPDETAGELHDRLAPIGAAALTEALAMLCAGTLRFTPQDHAAATLAPMLRKEDGRIDWARPAKAVHDRVRGAAPWPGAYIERAEGPLKVHATRLADGQGEPGTVIAHDKDGPRVACGEGAVTLLRVQRPGRNAITGAEFLRGTAPAIGSQIGGES
ncbi:MAG: methionyl-tRNA formyltransferase [Myxococcales bacterium]|nr:methionyl-tRNA formyltransferase [Myxococcales bacterium]